MFPDHPFLILFPKQSGGTVRLTGLRWHAIRFRRGTQESSGRVATLSWRTLKRCVGVTLWVTGTSLVLTGRAIVAYQEGIGRRLLIPRINWEDTGAFGFISWELMQQSSCFYLLGRPCLLPKRLLWVHWHHGSVSAWFTCRYVDGPVVVASGAVWCFIYYGMVLLPLAFSHAHWFSVLLRIFGHDLGTMETLLP